jgi:hypothetical protein
MNILETKTWTGFTIREMALLGRLLGNESEVAKQILPEESFDPEKETLKEFARRRAKQAEQIEKEIIRLGNKA